MSQQSQSAALRPPSAVLLAKILSMVLENGVAIAMRQERPHSVFALNRLRTQLLQDSFFDENHCPEELNDRLRTSGILFMDVVVLMARLLRVLMRQAPLTDEQRDERITIRNDCMNQPFFDRNLINTNRPFAHQEIGEDEGCFC